MGMINIALENFDIYLEGRVDILAQIAGATKEQAMEGVYDVMSGDYEVEGPDNAALQAVYDDWPAQYDAWKASNGLGPATLEEHKANAALIVDDYAGTTRSRFITVAPGQEMTYQEKAEEAADYVTAGYPADTSNFPFVAAEIAATGKPKEQAADDILAQKSAWIVVGAQIERIRLGGKVQIDAAANISEVDGVVNSTKLLLDAVG